MKFNFLFVISSTIYFFGCSHSFSRYVSLPNDHQIKKTRFEIYFNPNYGLQDLVIYKLKASDLRGFKSARLSEYLDDPNLNEKVGLNFNRNESYRHSGYSRGHLVPNADFSSDKKLQTETFYISNIAPQLQSFNNGSWKKLEEHVRKLACGESEILVITGLVLKPDTVEVFGPLKITRQFYKIIFKDEKPYKALAFLYDQEAEKNSVDQNMITVRELESVTGINFFQSFSQTEQDQFETRSVKKDWKTSNNCR